MPTLTCYFRKEVWNKIKAEAEATGKGWNQVVNDALEEYFRIKYTYGRDTRP